MTKHKFEILADLKAGAMTETQAELALGLTNSALRQVCTHWFPHLTKINQALKKLQEEQKDKAEQMEIKSNLAKALKVSLRQVNRVIEQAKIKLKTPTSVEKREKNKVIVHENSINKRKQHEIQAIRVITREISLNEAAIVAFISKRQMYRVCNQVCNKHLKISFKDLNLLHMHEMDEATLPLKGLDNG